MLIEIHMIQNHSPSNLNRDDLGAPKTCLFGGVTRARISSQCLKRSIRRSPDFETAMERDGGVRTRRLITVLAEKAHGSKPAPDTLLELVADAFLKGGVKSDLKKDSATDILMFVPTTTIDRMADAVCDASQRNAKPDELCDALAELLGEKAAVPDIALCGRMTELDSSGLFRKIDFHVEAALSAAHAISTHEVVNELDYFTAVDDLAVGTGAGHVNEAMYASACFYKHFSIDWEQLVENLAVVPKPGPDEDAEAHAKWEVEEKPPAQRLAACTLRHFLRAAALTTPSGKQHSFAAFNPPEGILVEVKTNRCTPISYANAFADPVPLRSPRGLIGESIARLGQEVREIAQGYGIEAERLWFSPSGRHPLTFVASGDEKPAIAEDGSVPTLDALITRVMEEVQNGDTSRAEEA